MSKTEKTKQILENYFEAMYAKKGWEELITDEITMSGSAIPLVKGKDEFIQQTNEFLQNVYEGKVRNMIVQDDWACVLTNYQIGHPDMAILDLDTCEIVHVKNGKVNSFELYFDSMAFANFMEKMKK
ncbi:hypothetical protein Q4Q35_10695 [Flavivirga aquimarina]|uniref:SnoaL-like domain-containing protein n=1 Tax=Flavivirga aquimarina TaxID=2027862 RepID=A0ABT8WAU8_9FLAO|nr:hypothetical protein [Flavivirga aquimarina]MDO5970273.1 hypothetical protein [Flavivirga aquimarina]